MSLQLHAQICASTASDSPAKSVQPAKGALIPRTLIATPTTILPFYGDLGSYGLETLILTPISKLVQVSMAYNWEEHRFTYSQCL